MYSLVLLVYYNKLRDSYFLPMACFVKVWGSLNGAGVQEGVGASELSFKYSQLSENISKSWKKSTERSPNYIFATLLSFLLLC